MDSRKRKLLTIFLTWFLVPIFPGSPRTIDPILKHMCSMVFGAKFWRAFLDCNILLDVRVQASLRTCMLVSSQDEAEITRCSICSQPDRWVKMMDCLNIHLIELQDESNPYLELSPSLHYRSCIGVLINEADKAVYKNVPFLPEDDRNFTSNCSYIEL